MNSCEASVVVASLQCYGGHLSVLAAGLNATWPVQQQSVPAAVDSANSSAALSAAGGRTHIAVGDGSFLQTLSLDNSLRESTTTAVAVLLVRAPLKVPVLLPATVNSSDTSTFSAEQVLLSWLAVLSSTYERPGLLSLCSLFSAWSAAALILAAIAVLLCAMLLADLCAVADLGSAARVGGEPGRAAYERQALRLAAAHLDSDQPAACQALLAGPEHVGAAVIDGVLPVTLPYQGGGQQEEGDSRAERERERCGRWLQGHSSASYESAAPALGFAVANMSGHWPTAHHYINHCTHTAETAEAVAVCPARFPPAPTTTTHLSLQN